MSTKVTQRTSYTPFTSALTREVDELRARARQLFEEPFGRLGRQGMAAPVTRLMDWYPLAEVTEKESMFNVALELPGMKSGDVHVDFTDGLLTIRGEKTSERVENDDTEKYHLWERSFGSFERVFEFGANVDVDKITAKFSDGVLNVMLPKRANAPGNGRRITIGG